MTPFNSHILIDSCIFSYLHSKQQKISEKTADFLDLLLNNSNQLYFSEFTRHELLRSATSNKRKTIEESLNQFIKVPITTERIDRATNLYSAYKNNTKINSLLHSISDIDLFIGALICNQNNTFLLTSNYDHYPRPFFLEQTHTRIEYGQKKLKSIYYFLLKANLQTLL